MHFIWQVYAFYIVSLCILYGKFMHFDSLYQVYVLPTKVLHETPGCGERNVKDTFVQDPDYTNITNITNEEQVQFTKDATNECWWGCKWINNPYYPKSWIFKRTDKYNVT